MSIEEDRVVRIRKLRRMLGLQGPHGDWVAELSADSQVRLLERMLAFQHRLQRASKTIH